MRRRCPPATVPTCHGTHPHPHPHLAGGYDTNICDEVTAAAQSCIEEKGSFSLCIPGGSVVAALANLKADGADWTKMHVFFCNEKVRFRCPTLTHALALALRLTLRPQPYP